MVTRLQKLKANARERTKILKEGFKKDYQKFKKITPQEKAAFVKYKSKFKISKNSRLRQPGNFRGLLSLPEKYNPEKVKKKPKVIYVYRELRRKKPTIKKFKPKIKVQQKKGIDRVDLPTTIGGYY